MSTIKVDKATDAAGTGPVDFTQGLNLNGSAITSGTWTPTVTGVTNIDSVTSTSSVYTRVGSKVNCAVRVGVNATTFTTTASNEITTVRFSLPISSTFSNDYECTGNGVDGDVAFITQTYGVCVADTSNNEAQYSFLALQGGLSYHSITFSYSII